MVIYTPLTLTYIYIHTYIWVWRRTITNTNANTNTNTSWCGGIDQMTNTARHTHAWLTISYYILHMVINGHNDDDDVTWHLYAWPIIYIYPYRCIWMAVRACVVTYINNTKMGRQINDSLINPNHTLYISYIWYTIMIIISYDVYNTINEWCNSNVITHGHGLVIIASNGKWATLTWKYMVHEHMI